MPPVSNTANPIDIRLPGETGVRRQGTEENMNIGSHEEVMSTIILTLGTIAFVASLAMTWHSLLEFDRHGPAGDSMSAISASRDGVTD